MRETLLSVQSCFWCNHLYHPLFVLCLVLPPPLPLTSLSSLFLRYNLGRRSAVDSGQFVTLGYHVDWAVCDIGLLC